MERETFINGYCRQMDGARTVAVEAEDHQLTETDCLYENCPYNRDCPVAEKIKTFLEEE